MNYNPAFCRRWTPTWWYCIFAATSAAPQQGRICGMLEPGGPAPPLIYNYEQIQAKEPQPSLAIASSVKAATLRCFALLQRQSAPYHLRIIQLCPACSPGLIQKAQIRSRKLTETSLRPSDGLQLRRTGRKHSLEI